MDHKKLLKRILFLIFFILIVNYIASSLYWYYSIWWFDMPMHFLGGFWLGLAFLWFLFVEKLSLQLIFKIMVGILLVGFLWEVFEVLVNDAITQNPFNILDTASDVFFDLAGGALAILYYIKRIMAPTPNKVE